MKKISLIVLILMMVTSYAEAGQQYATLASARRAMRRSLGYDTTAINALTDTAANDFIREGVVVVNNILHANKVEWVFATGYMDNSYSIDSSIIGIISVRFQKGDTVKPLLYVPMEIWHQQEHKTTSQQSNNYLKRPSYYDYTDANLFLYPTPTRKASDYDTIIVEGWRQFGSIDTLSSLTTIPEKYRPAVVKYATWQAAISVRHLMTQLFYQAYLDQLAGLNRGTQVAPSK